MGSDLLVCMTWSVAIHVMDIMEHWITPHQSKRTRKIPRPGGSNFQLISTPTMHECLWIPEVVRSICDESSKGRALQLGLSSRVLLQPALDSIWHELESFVPIIECPPRRPVKSQEEK